MPFAELESLRIYYELDGEAGLPVLLFSNSLGVNLSMWQPQIAALAPYFRVLRYDARGHGLSSIPPGPYSVGDMGEDVLRLLDHLGIDRGSFCGISMGGLIGQWLGIHAAGRVEKLVLANTAAKIGSLETWNARIQTVMEQGLAPIVQGTLERWFTPRFRLEDPATVAATAAMLKAADPDGYAACCAVVRDADFRESVQQIQAPTLVIAGNEDPVTTVADGRFLAGAIPSASFVELPAGHLSNVGAPKQFNAALLEFLC